MESTTFMLIVLIIAAVIVLNFYRKENSRITGHLHADNVKDLLTIRAIQHKICDEEIIDDPDKAASQVMELINHYESGKLANDAVN